MRGKKNVAMSQGRHQEKEPLAGNKPEPLEQLQEVEEECESGNKVVQEVKYSSRVQFKAPDIIELWWPGLRWVGA